MFHQQIGNVYFDMPNVSGVQPDHSQKSNHTVKLSSIGNDSREGNALLADGVFIFLPHKGVFSYRHAISVQNGDYTLQPGVEEEVFASMKIFRPLLWAPVQIRFDDGEEHISMSSKKQAFDLFNICFPCVWLLCGFGAVANRMGLFNWISPPPFSPLIGGGGVYCRKQPRLRFSVVRKVFGGKRDLLHTEPFIFL